MTYDQIRTYTSNDRTNTFRFGFKHCYDGWRAYILTPVNYHGLPNDGVSTHRYHDEENNLYYVCWEPLPDNIDACKTIVAIWSELTLGYLRTGESISSQFQRLCGR